MTTIVIEQNIKGTPCKIEIETDPTWGEFEKVIRSSTLPNGSQDGYKFLQELTKSAIKSGLSFDKNSPVEWNLLPMSEMTELVGKVMKNIPLGKYLDNLGKDNPILKQLS